MKFVELLYLSAQDFYNIDSTRSHQHEITNSEAHQHKVTNMKL